MKKFLVSNILLLILILQSGFIVVGHRGDPTKYAEETTQSFNSAFESGADYVELDLHVSKDNQLVVSHDRDLQRVTGTSAIVSQNNLADLNQLKQANGEPIYSLEQIFAYYQKKPNTKFLIETKKTKYNNPKNMEQLLVDLIKKYHMQNRVIIHSFSYKSLKTMSQLLPEVPRLFIVGSLKRINFEVIPYIDGINISSKLVTPTLISQLHALNKKVFVWDQMNEDPKQWNWLVNLPIDGVVTNYPATGYQYKVLKSESKTFKVNKEAIYIGTTNILTHQNPYLNIQTQNTIVPYQTVKIKNGVIVGEKKYYEIGNQSYVPAEYFNYNRDLDFYLPYLNKTISIKDPKINDVYDNPTAPTKVVGQLKPNQQYKILSINKNRNQPWFKTEIGWIQGKNTLINGIADTTQADFRTNRYFSIKVNKRLTNIALPTPPILKKNIPLTPFIDEIIRTNPQMLKKNDRM